MVSPVSSSVKGSSEQIFGVDTQKPVVKTK